MSLCVITPRDTDWMSVGLELKMVPTSPSRPALGEETSWQRWTTMHTLWCNLSVVLFSEHYVSRCSVSALQWQSYFNIMTAESSWNNSKFPFEKRIWLKDHLESVKASVLQIRYQGVTCGGSVCLLLIWLNTASTYQTLKFSFHSVLHCFTFFWGVFHLKIPKYSFPVIVPAVDFRLTTFL